MTCLSPSLQLKLFDFAWTLFAVALSSQRFLLTPLFSGLQIEGVTLDLFDNIFLLNLSLKATQSALQSLPILEMDFCQTDSPPSAYGGPHLC